MFNVDIIYNRETLYILVEGNLNKKNICKLKDRLYNIVRTYNILNIVLDVKKTNIFVELDLGFFRLLLARNTFFL